MAFNVDQIEQTISWVVYQDNQPETVTHVFEQLTEKDHRDYNRIAHVWRQKAGQAVNKGDVRKAAFTLWKRRIKAVKGYSCADGSDVMTRDDWRERVPAEHMVSAIYRLMKEEEVDPDDDPLAGPSDDTSSESSG